MEGSGLNRVVKMRFILFIKNEQYRRYFLVAHETSLIAISI